MKKRRGEKKKQTGKITGLILLCLAVILLFSTASASGLDEQAVVQIKVKNEVMYAEQGIPSLSVEVTSKSDSNMILNPKTKYTLGKLTEALQAGQGLTVTSTADGIQEGTFPVTAELSEDIKDLLNTEWIGKVKIQITDGSLVVKNKYGEWEKSKFKKPAGTYFKNEWLTLGDKIYYFGENEEKVTGWQDINSQKFYFDKDGVVQKGWLEEGDTKYYFGDTGAMTVGWLNLEDVRYYFDAEGKMVTGEQKIGTKTCVFGEDGKLESETGGPDPSRPMIALTFDDGPGPRTMELLAVLEKYKAHATFFMQGKNAANYQDAIKKMNEIGCELGNHSYDHPNLSKMSAGDIQSQIGSTNAEISKAAGAGATVMRPPYGAINETVKTNVGMPMILWSIDTLDWKTKSKEATVQSVLTTAGSGDIVLMHDIHSWSVDAAIEVIPKLIENGYQLVTVSEMAAAKGVVLENGGKYFSFK